MVYESTIMVFLKCFLCATILRTVVVQADLQLVTKDLGPISKPPNDKKEYRAVLLQNDMKAILVSDPNTTKAAASLTVAAGSMSNPPEFLGLAHFLEHMLFLGNEKYPEENGYEKFIVNNGGFDNAWTGDDATTYYFGVSPGALPETLDRFAAMFENPLLKKSALEREVKAVDSEYRKNIPNEDRRRSRIRSATGKVGHNYTQFYTGSLETLWTIPKEKGLDLRASLVDFFDKYYSSNLIHLAVLGSESLDELEIMVARLFGNIPNTNRTKPVWKEHYLGKDELKERIDMLPLGETRHVIIIFPIDYKPQIYKTDAVEYLKHMLNLEGRGSLVAFLRKKQLITELSCPPESMYSTLRGFATLEIHIELTKQGLLEVDNVTQHIFEYVEMLRDFGPQKWIWDEIRDINSVRFQFEDEPVSATLVQTLSTNSIEYPTEKLLYAREVDDSAMFDPTSVEKLWNQKIIPKNCRLIVTCKECENGTMPYKEKYFGIKYNRRKIDYETLQKWENSGVNAEFFLPQRNEFISYNFDLQPLDDQTKANPLTPRILLETNVSQVWYLQDSEFLLPKAIAIVEMQSPIANADPLSSNMNQLWATLITKSLWEFQHSANLAGLKVNIESTSSGIKLTFSGYNEKFATFMHRIFDKIVNFSMDPELFKTVKELRLQTLKNDKDKEPSDVLNEKLNFLLTDNKWDSEELLENMEAVTLEELDIFVEEYLSKLSFVWIFYGNLHAQESINIVQDCESLFATKGTRAPFPGQVTISRIVELPPGSSFVYKTFHPTHESSGVSVLFQIGLDSPKESVLIKLLTRIVKTPCYDQLRTKEQLGYRVGASLFLDKDSATNSLRIQVQGMAHPDFLESRIDNFLINFGETLQSMSEEEFSRHKLSQQKIFMEKLQSMSTRMTMVFNEIHTVRHNFNRTQVEIAVLEELTVEDLKNFFHEKVSNPSTRRRLVIQVISIAEGGAGMSQNLVRSDIDSDEIIDPSKWKQSLYLFSSFNPVQ